MARGPQMAVAGSTAFDTLRTLVLELPRSRLPEASRAVWAALAEGVITDDQAAELDALIKMRQATPRASELPRAQRRSVGSRPRSEASLRRRRMHVASGMMPPEIAASCTQGEAAALAIIAYEHATKGFCDLPVGAIGAKAGVCATTVRNALRLARKLGLVKVEERRLAYDRSLPNIVTIVDRDWQAWLRFRGSKLREGQQRGGCKSAPATDTHRSNPSTKTGTIAPAATGQRNRGVHGVRSGRADRSGQADQRLKT
jgi:hypothetical protein